MSHSGLLSLTVISGEAGSVKRLAESSRLYRERMQEELINYWRDKSKERGVKRVLVGDHRGAGTYNTHLLEERSNAPENLVIRRCRKIKAK